MHAASSFVLTPFDPLINCDVARLLLLSGMTLGSSHTRADGTDLMMEGSAGSEFAEVCSLSAEMVYSA